MSTVQSRSNSAGQTEGVCETANDYMELAREKAEELTETTEKLIRSRPAQALCVAAGIGFVLGACWMRR
ncbi:MAG: DUF883 family protein [Planctomycetes bacterium]|nr:DUF883 family protein [Planctomycetota bacterium]